jgi:hypothetical protein
MLGNPEENSGTMHRPLVCNWERHARGSSPLHPATPADSARQQAPLPAQPPGAPGAAPQPPTRARVRRGGPGRGERVSQGTYGELFNQVPASVQPAAEACGYSPGAAGIRSERVEAHGGGAAGHTTWMPVVAWAGETSGQGGSAVYPSLARLGARRRPQASRWRWPVTQGWGTGPHTL